MSEIAEILRALNGALGLICIAFCVYFLDKTTSSSS